MLTHLPADELSQPSPTYFLGYIISDDSLARGIADGLVDPVSKVPFNLPDHMDHILMRTQSNPSLSTSCQSHSSFKAVNKSIENPATPVAQQSKSIQETSSNGRHVTPIRKGKNLKDFFTPLSRHEKENSRNVMKSDISVLHRSNTCPSISSKKTQPFAHSTSPFQSHDKKKKLSFMESFVQSKKQKKFSPALSTKVALSLPIVVS